MEIGRGWVERDGFFEDGHGLVVFEVVEVLEALFDEVLLGGEGCDEGQEAGEHCSPWQAGGPAYRSCSAHCACSDITGSCEAASFCRAGRNFSFLVLPMAIATLRRKPWYLAQIGR